MNRRKSTSRAFTLIELMIVVAIIGILASIAIPNFVKFQCRSKQTEAKGNLKSLYVAEEAYRGEFDTYLVCTTTNCGLNGTSDLGFAPKGAKIRYAYSAGVVATNTFSASATVLAAFVGELSVDQWTVTQANNVTNATNGCK